LRRPPAGRRIRAPASRWRRDDVHLVDLDSGFAVALLDEGVELIPDLLHFGMMFGHAVGGVAVLPGQDLDDDRLGPFFLAREDDVRLGQHEPEFPACGVVLPDDGQEVLELAFLDMVGDVNGFRRSGRGRGSGDERQRQYQRCHLGSHRFLPTNLKVIPGDRRGGF